jgi:hypothetical protein
MGRFQTLATLQPNTFWAKEKPPTEETVILQLEVRSEPRRALRAVTEAIEQWWTGDQPGKTEQTNTQTCKQTVKNIDSEVITQEI